MLRPVTVIRCEFASVVYRPVHSTDSGYTVDPFRNRTPVVDNPLHASVSVTVAPVALLPSSVRPLSAKPAYGMNGIARLFHGAGAWKPGFVKFTYVDDTFGSTTYRLKLTLRLESLLSVPVTVMSG